MMIGSQTMCIPSHHKQEGPMETAKSENVRIVSLAPSHSEWIFELNAQEYLVARTDLCDQPKSVKLLPSIGGLFPYQLERILAYTPTDALMISGHTELKSQLERFGINVHQLQPKSLEDIYAQTIRLGSILHRDEQANAWVQKAKSALSTLEVIPNKPRTLVEVWFSPLTIAGHNSYIGNLVKVAGGELLLGEGAEWPVVPMETVIKFDPEVLFISTVGLYKQLISDTPPAIWGGISAVKTKNIHLLKGRLTRPSPRVMSELLWLNQRLKAVYSAP
jgi:iron complex transport system substrate-binding protein